MGDPKLQTPDENGNSGIGNYLNEQQVSEALGIPVGTLQRWRFVSKKSGEIIGPRYSKFSRLVRYDVADVRAYLENARQGVEVAQ